MFVCPSHSKLDLKWLSVWKVHTLEIFWNFLTLKKKLMFVCPSHSKLDAEMTKCRKRWYIRKIFENFHLWNFFIFFLLNFNFRNFFPLFARFFVYRVGGMAESAFFTRRNPESHVNQKRNSESGMHTACGIWAIFTAEFGIRDKLLAECGIMLQVLAEWRNSVFHD